MKRLTGLDASFLYMETPTTFMHVSSLMVLDPSTAPDTHLMDFVVDDVSLIGTPPPSLGEWIRRVDAIVQQAHAIAEVVFQIDVEREGHDLDDLKYWAQAIVAQTISHERDLETLAPLQSRLLDRAVELLKPGAILVYCVCSLELEEGEDQIKALLARDPRISRLPIAADDLFGRAEFVTPNGDMRTLPLHFPDQDPRWGGLDGFYAARLKRKTE